MDYREGPLAADALVRQRAGAGRRSVDARSRWIGSDRRAAPRRVLARPLHARDDGGAGGRPGRSRIFDLERRISSGRKTSCVNPPAEKWVGGGGRAEPASGPGARPPGPLATPSRRWRAAQTARVEAPPGGPVGAKRHA